ncbi:MAG: hypothetical protein A3J38_01965 [Gammaproteobacteria bacterium RIFCSPHIGHO2_12_FULL_45_9]|nr:MAG: hypothetical protein A3J38_01965 [Gammaproteobacteria bacterium RIFCSPHIGHO2_12_FULL_45_9]
MLDVNAPYHFSRYLLENAKLFDLTPERVTALLRDIGAAVEMDYFLKALDESCRLVHSPDGSYAILKTIEETIQQGFRGILADQYIIVYAEEKGMALTREGLLGEINQRKNVIEYLIDIAIDLINRPWQKRRLNLAGVHAFLPAVHSQTIVNQLSWMRKEIAQIIDHIIGVAFWLLLSLTDYNRQYLPILKTRALLLAACSLSVSIVLPDSRNAPASIELLGRQLDEQQVIAYWEYFLNTVNPTDMQLEATDDELEKAQFIYLNELKDELFAVNGYCIHLPRVRMVGLFSHPVEGLRCEIRGFRVDHQAALFTSNYHFQREQQVLREREAPQTEAETRKKQAAEARERNYFRFALEHGFGSGPYQLPLEKLSELWPNRGRNSTRQLDVMEVPVIQRIPKINRLLEKFLKQQQIVVPPVSTSVLPVLETTQTNDHALPPVTRGSSTSERRNSTQEMAATRGALRKSSTTVTDAPSPDPIVARPNLSRKSSATVANTVGSHSTAFSLFPDPTESKKSDRKSHAAAKQTDDKRYSSTHAKIARTSHTLPTDRALPDLVASKKTDSRVRLFHGHASSARSAVSVERKSSRSSVHQKMA